MSVRILPAPGALPLTALLAAVAAASVAAGFVLAAASAGHRLGQNQGLAALRADMHHRLALFAATAQGRIDRLAQVPATLELHPAVLAAFRAGGDKAQAAATDTLRALNQRHGGLAMFLVDERGIVVATSHAGGADDSRVGEDLSYRPYYLQALSGQPARHFSLGTAEGAATAEPGYFFAHPVHDGGRVVGVAVVKAPLSPIELALPLLGAPAAIVDANGVVVLASEPGWRYSTVRPLTVAARVDLELTGMYGDRRLAAFPLPLAWSAGEGAQAPPAALEQRINDGADGLLVQAQALEGVGWRLLAFSDLAPVQGRARVVAALAASAAALMVVTLLVLLQRARAVQQQRQSRRALQRLNAELEDTVARRTRALTEANDGLRREMAVRVQAEATLRAAQDELVQAAKLAVLGQLSTGITHELAQPLGAIRTLAGNAREFIRRGELDEAHGNLALVDTLVERMGGIIHPFKAFARKSPVAPEAATVAEALHSALFLLDARLRAAAVQLDLEVAEAEGGGPLQAWCNRNRLEQVLVNLIGNAVDAMQAAPLRRLAIRARQDEAGRIALTVADSGSGLPPAVRAGLFTPFFTTKPSGSGLGLGLVISRGIAQDYGGELTAAPRPEGGAVFTLRLPAAPPTERTPP